MTESICAICGLPTVCPPRPRTGAICARHPQHARVQLPAEWWGSLIGTLLAVAVGLGVVTLGFWIMITG